MKQEKRKIFSNEDNFDIIKLYIVKSRLWRDKRVVISRKWVISNEMDTGSRSPRARSASGLITHASWRIINISSSPREDSLVVPSETGDIAPVRRHGRTRLAFSSALYTLSIPSRSWIELESDAWSLDRSLIGVSAKLGPNSSGGVPRPMLGSNDFRIPFSLRATPIKGESFARSNLIVPPFHSARFLNTRQG